MEKIIKQYFCDRCKEEIKQPFKDPSVTIQRLFYTYHNGLSHVDNLFHVAQPTYPPSTHIYLAAIPAK